MNNRWSQHFEASRQETQQTGRLRARRGDESALCCFGSNDYLGLSRHPQVLRAAVEATRQGVWGSGSSPVIGGHSNYHADLERELACSSGMADCLTFSSGYACNVGAIACLAGPDVLILSDQLNHASLIDGIRLGRSEKVVFPHCDAEFVRDCLAATRHQFDKVLIVTESVFSMDGDLAPLAELAELSNAFDCGLIVDEAHATGLYGARGSGLIEELNLESAILLKLGTLSKAIGSIGGYACGTHEVIDHLVNHCRSYLFSTAPPAPVAAASLAAVKLIGELSRERSALCKCSTELRGRLRGLGWDVPDGASAIIPLKVGAESAALALSQRLLADGFYVPAIRPPTVPEGSSRLRISLSALHTDSQIDGLVAALGAVSTT